MTLKPHLACDVDLTKVKWPMLALPKIDGVRGLNLDGNITGRSLKAFKNKFVADCFSNEAFLGFDGELVLGDWTSPTLCADTTGFVNRKTAKPGKPTASPDFKWYIFDYLAPQAINKPYLERLTIVSDLIEALWAGEPNTVPNVFVVPATMVHSLEEFLQLEEHWLDVGFEGAILRDPEGMHKSGRATVKTGAYLRLKRFIDFEGEVVEIIEAMENTNEAKTNELGRTERSTHQENMVPKGMVGMVKKRSLADVLDPLSGKVLIAKDQIVDVGPGKMLHEDRIKFFKQPELLIGQVWKSKFFPKGHKDKPRFPTLVCPRAAEDMSE